MFNQKIQDAWNQCCKLADEADDILSTLSSVEVCSADYCRDYARSNMLKAQGNAIFYDMVANECGPFEVVCWKDGNPIVSGWSYQRGDGPKSLDGEVREIEGRRYTLVEVR